MTQLRKVQWLAAAAFAVMALAACGARPADGEGAAKSPGGKADAKAAVNVETPYAAIAAGKVDIEGGLVDVAARAPGIITEVLVQEGDLVKAGQVLARQEDNDSRLRRDSIAAQLRQAEAQIPITQVQLAAAQREEARLQKLMAEQAISDQAFQQAVDTRKQLEATLGAQKASVQTVRAQLAESNFQVELYQVRAPADGRIVRRYANPGSGASTLQVTPLFQLQPNMPRIVRAEVEERSLSQVKVDQTVEIVPEADQDKTFPGKVLRIAEVMGSRKLRSDDPSERTDERVVEVVVDAEQAPVLVGQRVFVKFLKAATKSQ